MPTLVSLKSTWRTSKVNRSQKEDAVVDMHKFAANHLNLRNILLSSLASYDTVCFSSNSSRGLMTVWILLPCSSAMSRKSIISLMDVSFMINMCLERI